MNDVFRRIIFLDIDGVLNSHKFFELSRGNSQKFDPIAVALLREVVTASDASLVISSTWRMGSGPERIRKCFREVGWLNPPIIGKTPIFWDRMRGLEIEAWLKDNPTEVYVIIDDDTDMLPYQFPYFVKCNFMLGFTATEAERVRELLK